MEYVILWLIMGGVVGIVAHSKGHSPVPWILYGALIWPIALTHVLVVAPAKGNASSVNSVDPATGVELAESARPWEEYGGQRTLDSARYKEFLIERYKIRRNDVLGEYIIDDQSFADVRAALQHAFDLHEKEIAEREETLRRMASVKPEDPRVIKLRRALNIPAPD